MKRREEKSKGEKERYKHLKAEFLMLAPGSDRLPVELFQILKDDAVESAALSMQYALNMQYAGSRQ